MPHELSGQAALPIEIDLERKKAEKQIHMTTKTFGAPGPARPKLRTYVIEHRATVSLRHSRYGGVETVKVDGNHRVRLVLRYFFAHNLVEHLSEIQNFLQRD